MVDKFRLVDFLARYPEMNPFAGNHYRVAREYGCALLVFGESHYLPKNSTVHDNVESWYGGTHDVLTDEEKRWINISEIISTKIEEGFKNPSHSIYRIGFQRINALGPRFDDYRRVFDYAVVCNYFLRPAKQNESLQVQGADIMAANLRFRQLLQCYAPNAIVFLSRKAYDCSAEVRRELSIPISGTPHPASHWWNRKSSKYGGRYGRDVVADAVSGLPWGNITA